MLIPTKISAIKNEDLFAIAESLFSFCRSISDDCYPSVFMSSDASYQEPDCDSSTLTPPKGFDQKQFWPTWATHIKLILLVLCWLLCSIAFMMRNEGSTKLHQISVPPAQYSRGHYISELPSKKKQVIVTLQGAILPSCYGNLSTHWLAVWIELVNLNVIPDNITDTMGFQIHDLRVSYVNDKQFKYLLPRALRPERCRLLRDPLWPRLLIFIAAISFRP